MDTNYSVTNHISIIERLLCSDQHRHCMSLRRHPRPHRPALVCRMQTRVLAQQLLHVRTRNSASPRLPSRTMALRRVHAGRAPVARIRWLRMLRATRMCPRHLPTCVSAFSFLTIMPSRPNICVFTRKLAKAKKRNQYVNGSFYVYNARK